ncbi:MAG: alkaline phosphatase family protein [Bacteroidales bacterium]|nr:alkaline phosphatase family protein [Bacteroidales bacterium]
MNRIYFCFLLIFLSLNSIAQNHINKTPKLVVGIVIEQMRHEMLLRYWESFGENGFKRIINNGVLCSQAHCNYLITQNGPGHASIVTGTNPSDHGIVSDNWYNKLNNRIVGCANDPKFYFENGKLIKNYSPQNIICSTLGDEMKLANNSRSKVVAISLNPVSSVISGGKLANYAFWFNVADGTWQTGSYYSDSLPLWVDDFNNKGFQDIYMDKNWASMHSLSDNYKNSLPDDNNFELGFENYRHTFPYDLSYLKKRSGDYKYLKYSPYGNTFTKDFAISAIVNEKLGKDQYPDFLSLSFSASNYVGQLFGPRSVEFEDVFLRLDKDLEHLINFLDKEVGLDNVLIYVTSDRGVADVPEYLMYKKQNAGIFDGAKAVTLLNSYLSVLHKDGEWIKSYYSRQIYFNQSLIDETGVDLFELQQNVASFMVQFNGVANAFPGLTINSTSFQSGVNQRVQNTYNQKRSGDVIVNLEPGWIEKNGKATNSGSAYAYDTHVPLIWFGWKTQQKHLDKSVEVIDIAPTISWILNITAPNSATGKPIYDILQ